MNFEFFLKSFSFRICHIFLAKKTGDKSGFGDKSGSDKSEDGYWDTFQDSPDDHI